MLPGAERSRYRLTVWFGAQALSLWGQPTGRLDGRDLMVAIISGGLLHHDRSTTPILNLAMAMQQRVWIKDLWGSWPARRRPTRVVFVLFLLALRIVSATEVRLSGNCDLSSGVVH